MRTSVFRPLDVRIAEALVALMFVSVPALILSAALPGLWGAPVLLFGLVLTVVAVRRALRIQVAFDDEAVTVTNYWRTYRLPWEEIGEVSLALGDLATSFLEAVAFVRADESRSIITSQATIARTRARRRFLEQLRSEAQRRDIPFSIGSKEL